MSKEIYNLGRVTGLSAYEMAMKHQLATYPELPLLTEREWLAATLASGSSMILKIPRGTSAGVHVYVMNTNCTLCAGTNLIAYPFLGECECDISGWATKVTSYGELVPNNAELHPTTNIPLPDHDISAEMKLAITKLKEYVKIVDGVIYQAGTWTENTEGDTPFMDFRPELDKGSSIVLYFREDIKQDLYIMFTGLVNRSVIAGVTKLDSSPLNSPKPYNGDFLGPEVFPWANKIMFTIPTSFMQLYNVYVSNISTDNDYLAYAANMEMGGNTITSIALEDTNGNKFAFTGNAGILSCDLDNTSQGMSYITWKALLDALATNKRIDVLGDKLRLFRSHLPNLHTEENLYVGKNGQVKGNMTVDGSLQVKKNVDIDGDLTVDKRITSNDLAVSNEYITINGIRIYVSATPPVGTTDDPIPNGSIGIGW